MRLDEARLRKARRLRARGVPLSDVVREAIDARYEAMTDRDARRDAAAVVRRIVDAHPDPPGLPTREYDVHDRAAAREAVITAIRRRGRGRNDAR